MNVRRAELRDAAPLLEMQLQLDGETNNMMYEVGERVAEISDKEQEIVEYIKSNSLYLVVEIEKKIIGFLCAERGRYNRIRHSAYLVIGILQSYQGLGIGSKLFRELDLWAHASSIKRLELTVMTHNKNAIKLYGKYGFETEGLKKKSLVIGDSFVDEYYMAKIT